MEGVSASMYTRVKSYWRRKGYQRINNDSGRRRGNSVKLGGATTASAAPRRRFWRIKMRPKLKILKISSPKKFFMWLRDAYVNMMLGFANSRVIGPGYDGGDGIINNFGKRPMKEYDEKMIMAIYKSLVMGQSHLAHGGDLPNRLGSVTVPRLTAVVE
ncbi:uncharacterized protein LOC126686073 [Mercurialis annua]|uniref:uncharacterized protein LOC126686073 n=1 Tax=Mercurialis annua TaxID=3986 RepID=UPI00216064A2|nr:uncharacterized protein LOC126686073 [Mercurialis annua]